jgi:hypothetical protein
MERPALCTASRPIRLETTPNAPLEDWEAVTLCMLKRIQSEARNVVKTFFHLFPNIGKDSTVSVFTEKKKVWAAKGYENTRKTLRCPLTPKLNLNVIRSVRNPIPQRTNRCPQLQNVLVVLGLLLIWRRVPG